MRWHHFLPVIFALLAVETRAAEVIPPAPAAYFNDYAGQVPAATAQALNAQLEQFERDTSDQILVAIYPHMQSDSSIEDYTVRVAQSWGVGQRARANGAVLFIFAQDHTLWIQTGYGLEASLPDALCKQIIDDEIVPRFKNGDFAGGVQAGVSAMLAAVRGEYHGNGRTVADRNGGGIGAGGIVSIVFILAFLIIWSIAQSRRHVVYNGVGRRSVWGGMPWIFPGGGFGGGGFGGGGGSGGGGFSGGGGSFGGGGAGGSW